MKQMEDKKIQIEYKGHTYSLAFNINVVEALQREFGSFDKWTDLIQPKEAGKETDLQALKFGFREAINEGIDIENEENGTDIEFLSMKQVGRIITEYGTDDAGKKLQEAVVKSVESDEKNA